MESAESVGVCRATVWELRKKDDAFDEQVRDALEVYRDSLEAEAHRRAVAGIGRPLAFQGKLTGDEVREYSDHLLLAMLKRHIPEYRDKAPVEIHAENGVVAIPVSEDDMTPQEFRERMNRAATANGKGRGDRLAVPKALDE